MILAEIVSLVEAALQHQALDVVVEVGERALAVCPSDPRLHTLLGQARLARDDLDAACREFDLVLAVDPENVDALAALGSAHLAAGRLPEAARAFERAYQLEPGRADVRDGLAGVRRLGDSAAPELSAEPPLAGLRRQLRRGELTAVVDATQALTVARPGDVLVPLLRAEALWRSGHAVEAERTCRQILTRYPRCLKAQVILGEILSADPQRTAEGAEVLAVAFAADPTASVTAPLLATMGLAPPPGSAPVEVPLPPSLRAALVAAAEGREGTAPEDEEPEAAQEGESVISPSHPPSLARSAGGRRRPDTPGDPTTPIEASGPEQSADWGCDAAADDVAPDTTAAPVDAPLRATRAAGSPRVAARDQLVLVSCRGAILARYGQDGLDRLQRRLRAVARELEPMGTTAHLIFVDDAESLAPFQTEPARSKHPVDVKRVVDDVSRWIRRHDAPDEATRVGVLLVGGEDVVPSFHLPNPAVDDDRTIPTDNPYGVADDDTLLTPSLPVGRLPDGSSGSITLLLRQVDSLVEARRLPRVEVPGRGILSASLHVLHALIQGGSTAATFACVASDAAGISSDVVNVLSPAAMVRASPPTDVNEFDTRWLRGRRFLFFGLNGVPGSEAWFGHPSFDDGTGTWQLPVTLTPDRLAGVDLAAPVVFSAVGYGADVRGRTTATSLALRFLGEGAAAFVGSTTSCYGADRRPLAGADLLGHLFWRQVRDGHPIGVALQRARRDFVAANLAQPGHLDGEDQKTLLQFVLYGDPLMPVCRERAGAAPDEEPIHLSAGALLCDRTGDAATGERPDPRQVRRALEYLADQYPEVADGAFRVLRRSRCSGACEHPTHLAALPAPASPAPVITAVSARIDCSVPSGGRVARVARVSVADDGSILKALVSR